MAVVQGPHLQRREVQGALKTVRSHKRAHVRCLEAEPKRYISLALCGISRLSLLPCTGCAAFTCLVLIGRFVRGRLVLVGCFVRAGSPT